MGEGHEEEGSHEAPRHEGSSSSGGKGHESHEEEGSHEAPRHEGSSSSEGHEGHEEEGSHEAPRHEGSSPKGHEGHEEVNMSSAFCSRYVHTLERCRHDSIGCVQQHG